MIDSLNEQTGKPLQEELMTQLAGYEVALSEGADMPTLEVAIDQWLSVAAILKQHADLQFAMLVDVCGVDYLEYGAGQWATDQTTSQGFSRAVEPTPSLQVIAWDKPRFAVVYHFLSLVYNRRVRVRVFFPSEKDLKIPSVISLWPSANWYERETYDLFGFEFTGHPDLRRLLTDYGFKGHPFRKDFPLIGEVEMRYDATLQRCVYEPVSIEPRVLVPKVVRVDNRYASSRPKEERSVQDRAPESGET